MRETLMALTLCLLAMHIALADSYEWIRREKIRGGYMSSRNLGEGLPRMKHVGMNLLIPKFGDLQAPPTDENIALLRRWGEAARALGLHLMPAFNFRGSQAEALFSERREVVKSGEIMRNTPCPLDEAYWEKYIVGRAVWLAEHAAALGLEGCIIDPEMYAADHTTFNAPCYCADCLREFAQAKGLTFPAELPAAQRAAWLELGGLEAAFAEHFVARIRHFCARLEREVHQRNANFLLGVLLLDTPALAHKGMALGLGTARHPVLCFSETTYSSGYSDYIEKQQQAFAEMGAHVLFVPGLWQQQFPSENLAEQYYHCAIHSAGYWIYTFESLLEDVSRLPGYQLAEPLERYWEAMWLANAELDKYLASGGTYVSSLKIRPYEPPLPVLTTGDYPRPALQRAPDPEPLTLGPVTRPRLRGRHALFILCRAGEPVAVRITNVQLANYRPGTQWALVDSQGQRLEEGYIKLRESHEIRFIPAQDGVYLVVAASGNNSHYMELLTEQPYAFLASEQHKLTVNGQLGRLYFYVPQGAKRFSLFVKATGQAAGRGGKITLFAPEGQPVARLAGDLGSLTEQDVDVPPGTAGRLWGLFAEDITNDLTLYFKGDVSPYVTPHSARAVTLRP